MKRTVFASPYAPNAETGGQRRDASILAALTRLGPVTLVYVGHGGGEPGADVLALPNLDVVPVTPSRGLRRAAAYLRARAAHVNDDFARGAIPELAAQATAAAGPNGRILASGLSAGASLLGSLRGRRVIYCASNLESAFRGDLQGASPGRTAEFERRLIARTAQTWMPTHREVAMTRELVPDADVRYVPNVVDVQAIAPVASRTGARRVVFAGNYAYPPNVDALYWLVDHVMPAVWERDAFVRLTVTGRQLPDDIGARDTRIDARGFVDDIAAVYAESDAVVVPLRQGGGTPVKFIEAMAYGLPVVATTLSARGLDAVAGRDYLAADTPHDIAAAVVDALGPNGASVGAAGRRLADASYSIDALTLALEDAGR